MTQTLSDVFLIEQQLNSLDVDVKHKATIYSKFSEEVIDASKELNVKLFHPFPGSKEYYWFIYKNQNISIRVKGPIVKFGL